MLSLLHFLACASAPGTDSDGSAGTFPIAPLPACELLPAGDAVDLQSGCAQGVCAGDTYAEYTAVLGEPDVCRESFDIGCEWGDAGLNVYFDDDDDDGEPDPTEIGDFIYLDDEALVSPEGLGLGVSLQCFIDELGLAEDIDLEVSGDQYFVSQLHYDAIGLYVRAEEDGVSDSVGLVGPD